MYSPPSSWVLRWLPQWKPGWTALDLACGRGRHVRLLAEAGLSVCAVDRDAEALQALDSCAETLCADLESAPWPLVGRSFDVVLVINYLWRPLLPFIREVVAPGGWLVYETFGQGQERWGRPRNPDYLLRPGELLQELAGWRIAAYEEGIERDPKSARVLQRVMARRPAEAPLAPLSELGSYLP